MFSKTLFSLLVLPAYGAVHEALDALPFGWTQSDLAVSSNAVIQLQVALPYQNVSKLEATLASVSTPGSPNYGEYMDLDNQTSMFAPSAESECKVKAWLAQSGATNIVSDGTTVSFKATVDKANIMLDTKFNVYTNGQTSVLRTIGYSVPSELAEHIDLITPTTYFGTMKAHAVIPSHTGSQTASPPPSKRQLQTSCETSIPVQISANETVEYTVLTPLCLQELYSTVGYKADPDSGSTIAFGSFLNQSASYSDLALFEQAFNIPAQNFTVLALINGGVNNQDPVTEMDGEANLDVQNIVGMVDGLPVYAYITGGLPPFVPDLLTPNASTEENEPYLQYYQYLLSQPNSKLPYVITNSYGDHENTVPERYAKRVCNMIGMMGLRGRTILESSGDEGVGAVCRANTGNMHPEFTPQFPGTCPYITAVGGTQFFNPEEAWNASSGGFSNYFPTAWYQKDAIKTYLNDYVSADTKEYYSSNQYVNFSGRGFPDVAAHSLYPYYTTWENGTAYANGGTSAASPIFASVFALINDARFRAGKPAIGFANPWLYGYASKGSLNDITAGASLGCQGTDLQSGEIVPGAGIIPYASWNATPGWDPTTGLGTPNFVKLKDLSIDVCDLPHIPAPVWNNPPSGGWGWPWGGHW